MKKRKSPWSLMEHSEEGIGIWRRFPKVGVIELRFTGLKRNLNKKNQILEAQAQILELRRPKRTSRSLTVTGWGVPLGGYLLCHGLDDVHDILKTVREALLTMFPTIVPNSPIGFDQIFIIGNKVSFPYLAKVLPQNSVKNRFPDREAYRLWVDALLANSLEAFMADYGEEVGDINEMFAEDDCRFLFEGLPSQEVYMR